MFDHHVGVTELLLFNKLFKMICRVRHMRAYPCRICCFDIRHREIGVKGKNSEKFRYFLGYRLIALKRRKRFVMGLLRLRIGAAARLRP